MGRNIFGWSYPPGCTGTPFDEELPCEICGEDVDDCICPECPECFTVGDPSCYEKHGLVRTKEQIASLQKREQQWAEDHKAEKEFFANYGKGFVETIFDED